tara:strand:+ start:14854 stop:15387 length:534 start_codon:yes stop_codon:yes gene_type:complete
MPQKSSVDSLPDEILDELGAILAAKKYSIDALVDWLSDKGYVISRSAMGRKAKKFHDVAAKMNQFKDVAKAFASELGAEVESDSHMVIMNMMQTLIMRATMNDLENEKSTLDPKDLMFLASSIKSLMGSAKDRQAIEEKARDKALTEAVEVVEAVGKRDGLTKKTVEEIRKKILGGG